MRLIELMVLKQDISSVIEFLGKKGNFQFQSHKSSSDEKAKPNIDMEMLASLEEAKVFLNKSSLTIDEEYLASCTKPTDEDRAAAQKFLESVEELKKKEAHLQSELKRVKDANEEALSFSNLKVPFDQLDHLSFLSLRIGKIEPSVLDELKFAVGERAVIIPLGNDKSRIMAAASKKARFALDSELKRFGFVNMEIPKDFRGVPDDVLESLKKELSETEKTFAFFEEEKANMAKAHEEILKKLLATFAIGSQIIEKQNTLESTDLVYRITGWIPEESCHEMMKQLDALTEGRIAIRIYEPYEIPSVINGTEKVPVKLKHGKLVSAFERLIFSYGSPAYGPIDPTPFVALFFTLLFGIMFGDAGQGFVFLLLGLLMSFKVIKVGGWNKFAPIFMAIGTSSMIMGILTGEFFGNEEILKPVARFLTGLFGTPRDQILHMMPNEGPKSIINMFIFFGFTVGVGFFINSIGLIVNIMNQFNLKRYGKAIFNKNGLSGAIFFWYLVVLILRVVIFKHEVSMFDIVIIAITLIATAFAEPLSKIVDKERPILENGVGIAIIEGVVELLETLISYLSNSISFIRVGAFALAHAVLGYIISTMSEMAGPAGIAVMLFGNAIVIVLEGMVVAIQVIRLQYYEFFSKFFNETGKEFKPFAFEYKN